MARRIVSDRKRIEIAPQGLVPRFLPRDVTRQLRQFLHRRLHARQLPFEGRHLLGERATLPVQRLHLVRHALELLQSRGEVPAVHLDRLELLLELIEHRAEARTQHPGAGGTDALLAQVDDPVPLGLELPPLPPQGVAPGLGFLLVAYPFGAACLQHA